MSVAAGFVCDDGVVLCADSEYSYGSLLKTRGTKIARPPAGEAVVLIAGSGAAAFTQGFFEDVRDALTNSGKTVPELGSTIRNALRELYRSFRVVPNWKDAESGGQFLIAVRGSEGTIAVWETETTRLNEVCECGCIGVGLHLGYYVAQTLYREGITLEDGKVAAAVLVSEASRNVQFVGGPGMIVSLPKQGEPSAMDANTIAESDDCYLQIMAKLRPVIFACLN